MVNDTCTLIEYIHSLHMIDKAAKKFLLLPKNTRIPFFYGLHKIHKPRCPLCPIVSGSYGPIDHLSAYNTHFIQSIANNLPSHVKDTKYFHHLIEKLQPLPPNAHLVTVDVTFLYKKIAHEEGIVAVIHFMEEYKHLLPTNRLPHNIVCIILDFILKKSNFKFMDTHIHQILGMPMGTRMALPYANLFLGKEERNIILSYLHLICIWKRFIDEIFFIFLVSHSHLNSLMRFMHTISPTIKYTFTYSKQTVTFLDVQIYLSETRKRKAKLYENQPTA